MHRSFLRLFLVLCASFAVTGVAAVGSAAQEVDHIPHPSHIHAGTCAELDPNPAYPLTDVSAVTPDAPEGAIEVAHSTIDVTIDELLASPHALNVHESAENVANYISCGDVAGPVVDGLLLIPMREQNDSGYFGMAAFAPNDAGGTNVSVYIAPDAAGGAAETVEAATAEEQVATETEEAVAEETEEAAVPDEIAVSIIDFTFDPQTLEIPVGTTVTWTNNDTAQHTATSNDGVWDSDILEQGESFSFTFEEAGTYDYICSLHPNMTGQIVVTAP